MYGYIEVPHLDRRFLMTKSSLEAFAGEETYDLSDEKKLHVRLELTTKCIRKVILDTYCAARNTHRGGVWRLHGITPRRRYRNPLRLLPKYLYLIARFHMWHRPQNHRLAPHNQSARSRDGA